MSYKMRPTTSSSPQDYYPQTPAPAYEKVGLSSGSRPSKWNPLHWSKRNKIIAAVIIAIVLLVAIIVGAVVGTQANAYPDYSPLKYSLQDTYAGADFFDNFHYFEGYDPTFGFVHYVPAETADAAQYNLTYASASSAVLRVDTSEKNASTGRFSVRVSSKKQYSSGLFIFDVLHSPYGCSTWPALWLSDPSNWPANGEIDVMEAVNQANTGNQVALHTSDGCNMNVKRKETGSAEYATCANSTNANAGCGVKGPASTFGEAFNAKGGGIYALELRAAGIRVWFFDRDSVPADLPTDVTNTTVSPDPSTWGEAFADFPSTHCDIGSHFRNQSIIANIDLCGTWAGDTKVYSTQNQCPGTCQDFVATNNTAFETAYWEFKSWRVYAAAN